MPRSIAGPNREPRPRRPGAGHRPRHAAVDERVRRPARVTVATIRARRPHLERATANGGEGPNAQEEERRTIARELHDEVGQALTAIRVELDLPNAQSRAAGGPRAVGGGAVDHRRCAADRPQPLAATASGGARRSGLPAVIDSSCEGSRDATTSVARCIRSICRRATTAPDRAGRLPHRPGGLSPTSPSTRAPRTATSA